MHLPTPMIKHSVRSSSRDNSAFMKMSNYLNIPTASEEGLKLRAIHTGNKNKNKIK